jgi:hypothetical protein
LITSGRKGRCWHQRSSGKNEEREKNEGKLSDNGESRNVKNVTIADMISMFAGIQIRSL